MQPELSAIRVVLAEDAVLLREGLASLLQHFGFAVAAAARDAEGLEAGVAEHHPDLVITDIRMPPTFTDEGSCAPPSACAALTPGSQWSC